MKAKTLILRLLVTGIDNSTITPSQQSLRRQHFLGLLDQVARKSTSMYSFQPMLLLIRLIFWRTSSKATTVWPVPAIFDYVPKALHTDIRNSRYYVASSNSLIIQCDTNRSQAENENETHGRLFDEIKQIYKKRIPGITTPETKKRIEQL